MKICTVSATHIDHSGANDTSTTVCATFEGCHHLRIARSGGQGWIFNHRSARTAHWQRLGPYPIPFQASPSDQHVYPPRGPRHMDRPGPLDRLTIANAANSRRGRHPRNMSGLTPVTPGGDFRGLQDVLAFIADFEMDPNATTDEETKGSEVSVRRDDEALEELFVENTKRPVLASTSLSTEAALLLPSTSQQPEPPKAPRRHRVSRKEELEYLRKKVQDMESKLQQLKLNSESKQSPTNSDASSSAEVSTLKQEQSIALWKTMAKRQKSQREMVESENAKLREKLKTQVRMAKSLQRILHKRERTADEITGGPSKRLRQLEGEASSAGSSVRFDALAQRLAALYMQSDEHISLCPVVSPLQAVIREQDVKYDDARGMYLEFKCSKLLPFDFEATNRALWRFTSETGIKFNTYFQESTEQQNDLVLRKFGVDINLDERAAKMSGHQAIRRYVEGQRVVIVRNSIVDRVELSDAASEGVTFRDVGWIVLKDASGMFGRAGPMTLLQSYSTLTPDIDLDLNSQWEVGALTDFVLQSRSDVEAGNDSVLESILLEETRRDNTPS